MSLAIPGAAETGGRRLAVAAWWVIAVVYAALLFRGLGDGHLGHWDASYTAERSREILRTGSVLDVHLNYEPDLRRPPLQYLQTAAALRWVGDRELAVRLWPALYAVACLPLLWLLSRGALPELALAAPAATLCFAFSQYFFHYSREALLDSGATFLLLLAALGAERARTDPRWFWLAAAAVVLGGLQKAPFGLLYVAVAVCVGVALRRPHRAGAHAIAAGVAAALGSLAWPALQVARHGPAFLATARREGFTDLVRGTADLAWSDALARIVEILFLRWGGIGLFALAATLLALVVRGLRQRPAIVTSAIFAALYLLVLSSLGKQSPRYLMPVTPFLALVSAYALAALSGLRSRRLLVMFGLLALTSLRPALRILGDRHAVLTPEVTAARELGSTIAADETAVVVSPSGHLALRPAFVLFYGDLDRPVRVLDADRPGVWTTTPPLAGAPLRGLAREEDIDSLRPTFPDLRVERTTGRYALFTATAGRPAGYVDG